MGEQTSIIRELARARHESARESSVASVWVPALSATLAAALCGLWIGALTLRLNPHIPPRGGEAALLLCELAVLYAAAGAVFGALLAGAAAAVRRLLPRRAAGSARLAAWGAGGAPILFALLLPDSGLSRGLLTRLIFERPPLLWLVTGVVALSVLVGVAALGRRALAATGRRWGISPSTSLLAAWGVAALVVVTLAWRGDPSAAAVRGTSPATPQHPLEMESARPSGGEPPPVILLCIDGADPDDMVWPLAASGQLETFAGLMEEGVWGELETDAPSLSPSLWTTLATGRSPDDHGIHHFTYFRLPGLEQVIHRFPLHTGLNFRLFPWLEKLPGMPPLRGPYTSTLRQTGALWNIVGERYPVGVYAWRVTWPAEEVNGFALASGVSLLEADRGYLGEQARRDSRLAFPPDALAGVELETFDTLELDWRRPSSGAKESLGDGDRMRAAARHADPGHLSQLWGLIEKYRPRFVAAGFYPVDAFHHFFSRDLAAGNDWAGAIPAAYRVTDRRLGELLARLGPAVNVIVVSDHGFDFSGHQHTHAPAGIFFARGPSFRRGAKVEGLSIYDVAPLVLHLLGLAVADDMPASRRLAFLETLAEPTPVRRIATYETGIRATGPVDSPNWKETEERLKALGYLP